MRLSLTVLTLSALFVAAANAQSGPVGFLSPSKNIACAYFDYDKQNTLRCDIMEATVTARRPADCDLEWGKAFEMRSKGSAVRLCYGDTVMDPKTAGAGLWRGLAARRIYLHVGAIRRDLLQRGPARIFAVAGEAGFVLREASLRRHGRA